MSTMCPRRQRGLGAIAAIFILVVLAGLGAFILTVSTTQQFGSALDVQGSRAYQSAQAGIEWGLYQTLKSSSCVASTDIGTVEGFAVTVNCTTVASGDAIEVGLGKIYSLTAWACSPAGAGTPACPGQTGSTSYVERSVSVVVEK